MAIGTTAPLLFLLPIYLASQTVPMLAELINVDGKAGKASGRVLFFSTVGSVAGGIVTPVWLFPYIGVARSTYVVFGLPAAPRPGMSAPPPLPPTTPAVARPPRRTPRFLPARRPPLLTLPFVAPP